MGENKNLTYQYHIVSSAVLKASEIQNQNTFYNLKSRNYQRIKKRKLKWQQNRETPVVCGAAIKTFIAKIWTLLNGNYFSKVAVMKIVHFKS